MVGTINDLYLDTRRALRDSGIEAYEVEAREILCKALDMRLEEFIASRRLYASDKAIGAVADFTVRRLRGEPLAYILGSWSFYGADIKVTRDVLIPRSDTETLVRCVLKRIERPDFRFLDMCTGSGCIAIALAQQRCDSRGVLADVCESALRVASENVAQNGLSSRLLCITCDALLPAQEKLGAFDVIVSNPPYITRAEMEELPESVKYEPYNALYGGEDGMDFYRAITKNYLKLLKNGGLLAFECASAQIEMLRQILKSAGLSEVRVMKDLGKRPRVVSGILI